MTQIKTCPRCGAALGAEALEGLCPGCLARAGLGEGGRAGGQAGSGATLGRPDPSGGAVGGGPVLRYFGDYELLEEIARGGMGVVYKARQMSLNRIVALKMILSGRLARPEFVSGSAPRRRPRPSCSTRNIVAIHEVGQHEGQHFFAMDFVEGQSLAERRGRRAAAGAGEAAELISKAIAEAIHYAHERGVAPPRPQAGQRPDRRERPARGSPTSAWPRRCEADSGLTRSGQVMGTPELHAAGAGRGPGRRKVGAGEPTCMRWGRSCMHLLTAGRRFRRATSLDDGAAGAATIGAGAAAAAQPGRAADLETICLKCLEKEPGPALRHGRGSWPTTWAATSIASRSWPVRPRGSTGCENGFVGNRPWPRWPA